MLKDLPRYECLLQAARRYPSLDPSATDAFLNLLRTGDEVFAAEAEFLAARGISQGRFTVLMLLNRGCETYSTPAALAEASGVTRATMTGLLDTLEKDRLTERQTDPNDRRTIHVTLTPKGQALIESLIPDYFRCVSGIMEPLDEVERTVLVSLLHKIQQGLAPLDLPEQADQPVPAGQSLELSEAVAELAPA
ncbi:MAG TPA: MarR family transcriptional regulator [Chthoniobacteraceae bacterium]|jgi:DNA-binding MarR family transcriptional regulator|nr:MarR family transcriptional regulator [Chthoniobacteraceae bacterium]